MAVTIRDIARAAGVSRGTVDRVINERGGVKPELEKKIRNLIRKMDYRPNRAGKILAGLKKPVRIGCFLPGIDNPFFTDVVRGFRKAGHELKDYGVSLALSQVKGYEPEKHILAIRKLLQKDISALCISTVDVPGVRELLNEIIAAGIPVVAVNSDVSRTGRLCYVGCDYEETGRTAAGILSLLRKNESIRVLVVTGSLKMQGHKRRIEGFVDTLQKRESPGEILEIYETMDDDETAYERTLEALKTHPGANCVYITTAAVVGVCRAIRELGLGKKITVLAHDDVSTTRALILEGMIPATICQEPVAQGYRSVMLLYEYLVNGTVPKKNCYFTRTVVKIRENL